MEETDGKISIDRAHLDNRFNIHASDYKDIDMLIIMESAFITTEFTASCFLVISFLMN